MSENFSCHQIIKAAGGFVAGAASVGSVPMRSIAFSVAALSFLAQSTVVYAQSVSNDHLWYRSRVDPNFIYIRNRVSNLCLGVVGVNNHTAGARAEVYYCDPAGSDAGYDNQWYLQQIGSYYRIRNRVSNLCLGVVGVDNHTAGAPVEVYDCSPSASDGKLDAQWYLSPVGSIGFETIKNRVSNLCLGVVGVNNHTAGAREEVYHCNQ